MEIAQSLAPTAPGRAGFSFLAKVAAAAALIAFADILFLFQRIGWTLGLFAGALLLSVLLIRRQVLRQRPAAIAAAAAGIFALVLVEDANLLALFLFLTAITLAVLLPRATIFGDGWRWAKMLVRHGFASAIGPAADLIRLRRAVRRRPRPHEASVLIVPAAGSALFLLLFTAANPLIADALARLDPAGLLSERSLARILFWGLMLLLVWSLLRPRPFAPARLLEAREQPFPIPGFSIASVTVSLIAFNALFGLQNGLDLAFLWSGAPLPDGMTLAEYAHRGAYPLIATALLAGLFVILTLRPASALAESPLIRRLVYLWIAQNVFLVASTMLRTIDYVEAYSLTRLRIAALVWMLLVAAGLILICVRIWRRRSDGWLINANLAALLIALGICSVADLGRIAAGWNVRHAREAGGSGANLDLCYLARLGASALLPIIELEGRTSDAELKHRLGSVRMATMAALARTQADWRGWTWRGARRLSAAAREGRRKQLPHTYPVAGDCRGHRPPEPLTPAGAR